jgi:hypothetical protein
MTYSCYKCSEVIDRETFDACLLTYVPCTLCVSYVVLLLNVARDIVCGVTARLILWLGIYEINILMKELALIIM